MQNKADTLARLQNYILSLQGYKPAHAALQIDFGLGRIVHSFPNDSFPFSALHEFTCNSEEECASSGAFVGGLLSSSLNKGGIALWVGTKRHIFPPALKAFGINADQVIFVELKKEREALWTIEEALKCATLTTVVGEMTELDFTESRRLPLAIEKSGVGCFLLRHRPRNSTTASTSRWHVTPLPSAVEDGIPGVCHLRWQVDLVKVRNGRPGSWVVEWRGGRFRHATKLATIRGEERQVKTG